MSGHPDFADSPTGNRAKSSDFKGLAASSTAFSQRSLNSSFKASAPCSFHSLKAAANTLRRCCASACRSRATWLFQAPNALPRLRPRAFCNIKSSFDRLSSFPWKDKSIRQAQRESLCSIKPRVFSSMASICRCRRRCCCWCWSLRARSRALQSARCRQSVSKLRRPSIWRCPSAFSSSWQCFVLRNMQRCRSTQR